jgi:integrase/recombinase XerC
VRSGEHARRLSADKPGWTEPRRRPAATLWDCKGTGCRLDEIRGIDPERDFDWTRGTVHVIGKFRNERDVPMQPDARTALEEQLDEDGKLWTQNPQRLRDVMAKGSARAKIPSLTPHSLRHTFGTRWLQAGGDICKLSKILGHSTVAVTEAHYSPQGRPQNAARARPPLARR